MNISFSQSSSFLTASRSVAVPAVKNNELILELNALVNIKKCYSKAFLSISSRSFMFLLCRNQCPRRGSLVGPLCFRLCTTIRLIFFKKHVRTLIKRILTLFNINMFFHYRRKPGAASFSRYRITGHVLCSHSAVRTQCAALLLFWKNRQLDSVTISIYLTVSLLVSLDLIVKKLF